MRKVELSLKEKLKYETIKKLVETNGNKERARIKLKLKSIRQINRLIAGYKEYGKEFFVHGNRGRQPKHALTTEFKDEIELLYNSKYLEKNIFYLLDLAKKLERILRNNYLLKKKKLKQKKKCLRSKLT